MRRRKSPERDFEDLIKVGAAFVLLLVLMAMFRPRVFWGLAFLFTVVLVIALSVILVPMIFRKARNRERQRQARVTMQSAALHGTTTDLNVLSSDLNASGSFVVARTVQALPISKEDLRAIDWFQFEKVVAALYESRGCRVERRGGANPDGGIDLVISENGQRVAVQCKHWKAWKVGVRHLREFFGGMKAEGFDRGIFALLEGCTNEAREFALAHNITILEADDIRRMLAKVETHSSLDIQAIFDDKTKHCPKCGAPMVIRTGRRGLNPGSQFWGCSTFPYSGCRGFMRLEE